MILGVLHVGVGKLQIPTSREAEGLSGGGGFIGSLNGCSASAAFPARQVENADLVALCYQRGCRAAGV